jgi:flagellar protein FliO/FliZ
MHKNIKFIFFIVVLCLIENMATAADLARGGANIANADNPVSLSYALQILVSFLAVIGFILLLAWLMRRTGRFGVENNKILKVIASMSLGMREKILLIEVEGVNIVVGIAPGHIRTLHVYEKNTNIENKIDKKPSEESGAFKQIMAKYLK